MHLKNFLIFLCLLVVTTAKFGHSDFKEATLKLHDVQQLEKDRVMAEKVSEMEESNEWKEIEMPDY